PQARFHELDVRDPEFAQLVLAERPEVINHHAAQTMVRVTAEQPQYDAQVNVLGMINLLQAAVEAGVRKGRIPRRRYKVQKKTLETRLNTLTRNIDDLKQKLWAAGGRYADLMRQLEVAEAEINEVEADIRSIEMRHRRGELSLEAYRKLLGDYERRKGNAETKINGILVRLREEIC
ncbi:MAG: GDP-mannose 4,6-dehydratase, partial [Candidatus Bathyarchaeia archaeon]